MTNKRLSAPDFSVSSVVKKNPARAGGWQRATQSSSVPPVATSTLNKDEP